jgi:hypothetical protein
MSRINIEIPNKEYQILKIIAAASSTSIKEIVLSAVKERIQYQLNKTLNEITLQTFKEVEIGVGLTKHKTLAALFNDLDLGDIKNH